VNFLKNIIFHIFYLTKNNKNTPPLFRFFVKNGVFLKVVGFVAIISRVRARERFDFRRSNLNKYHQ